MILLMVGLMLSLLVLHPFAFKTPHNYAGEMVDCKSGLLLRISRAVAAPEFIAQRMGCSKEVNLLLSSVGLSNFRRGRSLRNYSALTHSLNTERLRVVIEGGVEDHALEEGKDDVGWLILHFPARSSTKFI
ncbi:hypothetical protein DMENIID0001_118800 [Sergentomyia squamirostris]